MKIFISGASGLLGGNCLRYFKKQGLDVIGSHLSFPTGETVYFDTLHPEEPNNFDVLHFNPDIIIHCGALTHVDYCESHEEESFEQTVKSTQHLVELAQRCNARFVFISTDYVFDGTQGPYRETDTVNPLSTYGKHKLIAESFVLSNMENSLVLRVTNVYGEEARGKNFVARIISQCQAGHKFELKLPSDQFASPTNAWDIARALYLLLRDDKLGIYHIGGTDYMNRVSLALKVLSYFPHASCEVTALKTIDMNQAAPRPLLGGFVPFKFMTEYPDFLFGTVDTYVWRVVRDPDA
jgi:dTDP-4-dehydrorhamnose reductase